MKKVALLVVVLACFVSNEAVLAQFTPGQTVSVDYVGKPREGRIVRKEVNGKQWLIEFRNALTGQYDGSTFQDYATEQISAAPANPDEYGNQNGAMERHQGGQFQPGQTVTWMGSGKMEQGRVIRQDPSGVLVETPNWQTGQYDGSARAYHLPADLNVAEATPPAQPAKTQHRVAPQPAIQPVNKPLNQAAEPNVQPGERQIAPAGAQLSEADILDFLAARLGPRDTVHLVDYGVRQKCYDDLVSLIEARGVNFKYKIPSKFVDDLGKYLVPTAVPSAIQKNFGAPTTMEFLMGRWKMDQVGETFTHVEDGYVKRRLEKGGETGELSIEPTGHYKWGNIQGQWRKAEPADYKNAFGKVSIEKGGAGIVLLNAKTGTNWIVWEDDMAGGDSIRVTEVGFPDHSERGGRIK